MLGEGTTQSLEAIHLTGNICNNYQLRWFHHHDDKHNTIDDASSFLQISFFLYLGGIDICDLNKELAVKIKLRKVIKEINILICSIEKLYNEIWLK